MDKEAKTLVKKKQILDALKRCLERSVYSNITVQEVADESGFSKGGLLYYFPSKEDMYLELLDNIFEEMKKDHSAFLHESLQTGEKASLSALYGIEKFFMDKQTVKIFLNIMLYSFEDEEIGAKVNKFIKEHRQLYQDIIIESRNDSSQKSKNQAEDEEFSVELTARIAQTLVLASGILEAIESTDMDYTGLVKYIMRLLKG